MERAPSTEGLIDINNTRDSYPKKIKRNMEVLIQKTKEAFGTTKERTLEKPETAHVKDTAKLLKHDYNELMKNTNKWVGALHDFQYKWESLSYVMRTFGLEQFVDGRSISRMSEVQREIQLLLYPLVQSTKSGLANETERIYKSDVGHLKKVQSKLDEDRIKADVANGKFIRYSEKRHPNEVKLRRLESERDYALREYDDSFADYYQKVHNIECQSDGELVNHVQKLIDEIAMFFAQAYRVIDEFYRGEFQTMPRTATIHSKIERMNLNVNSPKMGPAITTISNPPGMMMSPRMSGISAPGGGTVVYSYAPSGQTTQSTTIAPTYETEAAPTYKYPSESSTTTTAQKRRIVWDEENLTINELQKSSTMKIDEPKTPYHYYESEEECGIK
eukprot:gene3615-4143_t